MVASCADNEGANRQQEAKTTRVVAILFMALLLRKILPRGCIETIPSGVRERKRKVDGTLNRG